MPSAIKAPRLQPGDAIGIFSPSDAVTEGLRPQFELGIQTLKGFGLKVVVAPNALAEHYGSAGTREQRLADFHALYSDPSIKMLLMSHGGSTANQLLNGLDFELIRKTPKIVAGISDGTTLLNAIHAKTGLITFHGPDLIWTFGRPVSRTIRDNFLGTLFGEESPEMRQNPDWRKLDEKPAKMRPWKGLRPGRAQGKLIGGHIGVFQGISYGGFEPVLDDSILFLEGLENFHLLSRQLYNFRLRGVYDRIAGLILGWFDTIETATPSPRTVAALVEEATQGYSFPILEISDLGHNVENLVLPVGCRAEMNASDLSLRLLEKPVTG